MSLGLTGCPAPVDPPADTDASDSTGSTGSASGNTTTSTGSVGQDSSDGSTDAGSTTTDAATDSSSSGGSTDDTTGEPPSFDCPPVPGEPQCDIIAQDCPAGFKCILWDDDGSIFDSGMTVCAPVDPDPAPLYDACTNDVATCSDDCSDGATCLPLSGSDGACVEMCGEDESCSGDQVCDTCATCSVAWCMPTCDPIAPQCAELLGSCWLDNTFGQTAFSCVGPPPGNAGPGDPCSGELCQEGLFCMSQDALGPGCTDAGCCTEFCDLTDPAAMCGNPAHVCIPLLIPGEALPSQEHIGVCALPEAHPCNTPGQCPPPGIDDTYPWCSQANGNFCPRGDFGFGNGVECIEGCMCIENCTLDTDCPVPPTGNAVPQCLMMGGGGQNDRCVLACGGGQACPDGMECRPEWGDVCMWVSDVPPNEC